MVNPGRGTGRGRGRPPQSTRHGPPKRNTPFGSNAMKNRHLQREQSPGREFRHPPMRRSEIDLDWRAHNNTTTANDNDTIITSEKDILINDSNIDSWERQPNEETTTQKSQTMGSNHGTSGEQKDHEQDAVQDHCVASIESKSQKATDDRIQGDADSTTNATQKITTQATTDDVNEDKNDKDLTSAHPLSNDRESFQTTMNDSLHNVNPGENSSSDDMDYNPEEDDKDEESEWNSEDYKKEDDGIVSLPPVPASKTQPTIAFSILQIRAEFTSNGQFTPIPTTRELIRTLVSHPLVIGCADNDNKIITTQNFPKDEEGYKKMARMEFSQLSRNKHRMSIVLDLATKEQMDITELKSPQILTYLRQERVFLDSHRYEDISTAEIGFFTSLHDKITNRDVLHEFISQYYESVHDDTIPEFETYTKNMFCRQGHERAFARVVAMRCGRSDATEMKDFLCLMADRKAFEQAEFIPQGIAQKLLIRKLSQQNKYIDSVTAFPVQGFNQEILATEVTAGERRLPLRKYIMECAHAEKIEPTQYHDRWLMVVPKTEYDNVVRFVDETMPRLFTDHNLPRHHLHDIPHRPGSRYTKSPIYNKYTDMINAEDPIDRRFSRPPSRQQQTRLEVSYAAAASKAVTKPKPSKTPIMSPTPTSHTTLQRVKQSVRQQINNNSIEIQADLRAQVRALQEQINALNTTIVLLQEQITKLTPPSKTSSTTTMKNDQTTGTMMAIDKPSSLPRTPATKRPRKSQPDNNTSETDPNFADSLEDPSTQENPTQPTPPTDPTQGLDPGESDSIL